MAKGLYFGVNDIAKKVAKIYVSKNDDANISLPTGYARLRYIQSSGSLDYIDTGIYPDQNTTIEIDYQFTEISAQQRLFGARGDLWLEMYINANLKYAFNYKNTSSNSKSTGVDVAAGRQVLKFDGYNKVITLNGAQIADLSGYTVTNTASSTLGLFAPNTTYANKAYFKLYSCKIYSSGVLVRDYIPCIYNSVAGLYDLVNGVMYVNGTSGIFATGSLDMNTAKTVTKGYIGINGIAVQFFGLGIYFHFNKPSSSGRATADSEYSGFDGNSIRLAFTNAVRNSGQSEFVCRMYIYNVDNTLWGKTLTFNYSMSGAAYQTYFTPEVMYRYGDNQDLRKDRLVITTGTTYTGTVPEGTEYIVIGYWSGKDNVSGELIMSNMTLGDTNIV